MLTDLQCRKAKAGERDYKLSDEKGMYLFVTTTGFKSWRWKYRIKVAGPAGTAVKEKLLNLGTYPETSLNQARELRDEARKLLRSGIDPSVDRRQKQAQRAIDAGRHFDTIARAWMKERSSAWAPRYAKKSLEAFERDIFPTLGNLPIGEITVPLILETLRAVENRGAIETAHRLRQHLSEVFLYGIAAGLASSDPAHMVKSALKPVQKGRRPAARLVEEARSYLIAIEAQPAFPMTLLASRLLALTAARPGIVQLAEPGEFVGLDSAEPLWCVPAQKMKLTRQRKADSAFDFVMPLARQSVDVVRAALKFAGADSVYLFPSVRSGRRPISNSTLSKLYRDAGLTGRHVPHGWRASFSTVMNELAAVENRLGDRQIIDLMLAHIQDGVEAIYNRAAYMPRRRELAQEWADLLMRDMPAASTMLQDG